MNQRALALAKRTSFEFAPALRPISPLAELVSSALSDSTSIVNEMLVPTVTSPVMLVVTLFSVLVAPSATTWARSVVVARNTTIEQTEEDFMDCSLLVQGVMRAACREAASCLPQCFHVGTVPRPTTVAEIGRNACS